MIAKRDKWKVKQIVFQASYYSEVYVGMFFFSQPSSTKKGKCGLKENSHIFKVLQQ